MATTDIRTVDLRCGLEEKHSVRAFAYSVRKALGILWHLQAFQMTPSKGGLILSHRFDTHEEECMVLR